MTIYGQHGWRHLEDDEIPGLLRFVGSGNPTPKTGDLLVGSGSPPGFTLLPVSVPAANVRNVLGLDNGDTTPAWKTGLDSTNPAAVAAAASPGTSLVFAHRDHVHAGTHPILDASLHSDSAAQGVTAGSIIYGNNTPKWDELVIGSAGQVLTVAAGLPSWAAAAGGGGGPIYIPFGTDRAGQSFTPA